MAENSKYVKLTDQNFGSEVLDSAKPVLVDFWADWCAPCHRIAPAIEELAKQYDGTVKVGKLNIDENQQAPSDFGISSIPAVLIFKDGKVVETLVGVQPKERYEAALGQVAA